LKAIATTTRPSIGKSPVLGFYISTFFSYLKMRQQLITAAFFMEGLHDARPDHNAQPNYDVLIKTWDKGCIELVDSLVSYVPVTEQLCEAALSCDGMYPGVFDYEVSGPFGKWFGEYILEHGDEPSCEDAHTWLLIRIWEFFTQGMTGEQTNQVHAVISKKALEAGIALAA
jgi:hypothetical protein